MTHNLAGIALYKKMGFEIEGRKRHSLRVNGAYVDEYYMSKLLDGLRPAGCAFKSLHCDLDPSNRR